MALSGGFLHVVKTEMLNLGLIGARVEKIHQPSREEIVLSLHTHGGAQKLLFSANPATARVCLTSRTPENPPVPPMFCQLLRKKLCGGRLIEIAQDGLERIIFFRFQCRNEIGDEEFITLSIEIMGRSSNLILLLQKGPELRIIDAIKRVTDEVSSVRRVLPGLLYELPPRENRLSLLSFSQVEFEQKLQNFSSEKLHKVLIKIFEGICPLFAREAAFRASGDTDVAVSDIDSEKIIRLVEFMRLASVSLSEKPTPVMLSDTENKPCAFAFIDIKQYGTEGITVQHFNSANALIDCFYHERAELNRIAQRAGSMLKTLNNRYERVLRKIDARRSDLAACAAREKFRKWGEMINANLYRLKSGAESLTAHDYESGEEVVIPLDTRLAPAKNAQKYYAEYKRLQNAEKALADLIKDSEQELIYLESVLDAASRAVTDSDLLEIKRELIETGYLRGNATTANSKNSKKPKQEKPAEPLKFRSTDGELILVGRNNRQNDALTLKTAKPDEIWLHAKDYAGSHVVIKSAKPSEKTLQEAAQIAAYCSKARTSSRVPIDYTQIRYVKKPAGAKPGMVIFTHNKTLYVTPSEEVFEGLKI
ncbi:MAG: NFACT family protein [Oscillospiraceae bacterium]|nr:NFACT family protein [Oscillospiraceae bacterium]